MINESIEVINVEDQARDDDSVKSIDTIDTDLNRDFTCFEMDDTHASLENCSMLPIECRSVTGDTYKELKSMETETIRTTCLQLPSRKLKICLQTKQ